jgi:hypothetical protein
MQCESVLAPLVCRARGELRFISSGVARKGRCQDAGVIDKYLQWPSGRFKANASVAAGDYGDFAAQIRTGEYLSGCRGRSEARVDRRLFAWH